MSQGVYYKTLPELKNIFFLMAIPAEIIFLYYFYDKLYVYGRKYITSLDKVEKVFLTFGSIVVIVGISCIYNMTDVFYKAEVDEEDYRYSASDNLDEKTLNFIVRHLYEVNHYDVIYTSDTVQILYQDAYTHVTVPQNDIKQSLFAVFSIPFHILPKLVANIIPSIPNLYAILIAITEAILILIAFTLLARLMKLNSISKIFFLIILLLAYPTLLFMINLEQYLMSVFYLIVFLYFSFYHQEDKDIAYIAMTGSMITSGILFPLLGEKKNVKQSIKNIFCTFLKYMVVFIISAKIILLFPTVIQGQLAGIKYFSNTTKISNIEKWNMYTEFLKNTIYFSKFVINENYRLKYSFTMNEKPTSIIIESTCIQSAYPIRMNVVGISILLLAILGFVLNRKDKFSKIAFTWCLLSFILLFVLSWGLVENGLILYTFYFSWAFICLIFKFFEKALQKFSKIKYTVYTILTTSMTFINLYGIYQVILFGIQYFKY